MTHREVEQDELFGHLVKCLFDKAYSHRTFTVQCHMTSQVTGGKHNRVTVVCRMENKKDDSLMKDRFLEVKKEIYKRYTEKHQTEQ